jgi:hypothetical protein
MKSVEYVIRIRDDGATEVVKKMGDEVAKTNKAFEQGSKVGQRDIKAQAGSVDDLTRRIKSLTESRNRFANPQIVDNYNKRIRALTEEKLRLQGVTDRAEQSTKQWGLGAVAAAALAAKAVFEVGKAFVRTASEAVELAKRQQQAEQRVESLVKTTGMAAGFTAKQLREMASEIQAMTTFGDEQILEAQAMLLTFRSIAGDVFERTLKAATDLSATGFGTLEQATKQLGKALEDPTIGLSALREVGVSFSKTQIENIKNLHAQGDLYGAQVALLKQVEIQVKGTAEALAQTPTGQIEQLKNLTADLKENFGTLILNGTEPFVRSMKDLVQQAISFTAIRLSDKLRDEQAQFMAVAKSVTDGNLSMENRNAALRELGRLSPDIVGKLDLETVSNEDLATAVKSVNDQYTERIRLQAAQELYQDAFTKAVSAEADVLRTQVELNKEINAIAVARPGLDILNKSLEEQVDIIGRLAVEAGQTQAALQGAGVSTSGALAALTAYNSAVETSAEAQSELNGVLQLTDVIESRTEQARKERESEQAERVKRAAEAELARLNAQSESLQAFLTAELEADQAFWDKKLELEVAFWAKMDEIRTAEQLGAVDWDQAFIDGMIARNEDMQAQIIANEQETTEETIKEIDRRKKARMTEAMIMARTINDIITQQNRQIRSERDLANSVIDEVFRVVQAKLAASIASGMASVFATVPFPFNIAAAAAIGGSINLLFNQARAALSGVGSGSSFGASFGDGDYYANRDKRRGREIITPPSTEAMDAGRTGRRESSMQSITVQVVGQIDNEVIRLANQRADDVRSSFI